MNRKLKNGLLLIFCLIIFYGSGFWFYEKYFDLQLQITKLFASKEILFCGKFQIFGDPNFSLITALIPIFTLLPCLISKKYGLKNYLISLSIILITILICSLIFGYFDSIRILKNVEWTRSIDDKLVVPLYQIKILKPYISGILGGTIISSLINYYIRQKNASR